MRFQVTMACGHRDLTAGSSAIYSNHTDAAESIDAPAIESARSNMSLLGIGCTRPIQPPMPKAKQTVAIRNAPLLSTLSFLQFLRARRIAKNTAIPIAPVRK